jgi:DNA polymerase III delta prime subunit
MDAITAQLALTCRRLNAVADTTPIDGPWTCEDELGGLRERLGLTSTELAIVWVLIAHEIVPTARELVRRINTEQVSDPTRDTLRRAVYGDRPSRAGWQELSGDGRLQRLALVEVVDGTGPYHRHTLRIAGRVLAMVHGELELDPEIATIADTPATFRRLDELQISPATALDIARALVAEPGLVIVSGRAGTGRRSVLAAVAAEHGLDVLEVDARAIATDIDGASRQLRVIARECALFAKVPLVRNLDVLGDHLDILDRELSGLVLATTSRSIVRRWRRPPTLIELPPPTGAQRAAVWSRIVPELAADRFAAIYPLAPALIHAVGEVAAKQAGPDAIDDSHVAVGLRSILDDRLAGLATRIETTGTWDDLVVPEHQETALVELVARIRERRRVYEDWGFGDKVSRGLGVSALFSGPPGTGKTMAAGLVAKELAAELYQVDLSKIASKWIGETEKNLAALFDAAEAGHAILLFDEADALFGKRTDVKSSNDRYANQEVNFLLQRIESYAGIAILTTNHDSAIDEAFRRRLAVHVRFEIPDTDERERLWRRMLPSAAPIAPNIDLDALAESYVMSGGHIRNAVVRAAFLAANDRSAIRGDHFARAARLEYEAMGKVIANH